MKSLQGAVVILLVSLVAFTGQADELDEIKSAAFEYAHLVSSFDLTARIERSNGAIWNVRFSRKGDLYRIDRENEAFAQRDGKNIVAPYTSWAFDGSRYQSYNARDGNLKIANGKHAVGSPDPIMIPFGWVPATLCKAPTWQLVRSRSSWDDCFDKASFIGREQSQGYDCKVVEFDQSCAMEPCTIKVFFATELAHAPVRYERYVNKDNSLTTVFEVEEFMKVSSGAVQFAVPLRMTRDEKATDGVSLKIRETVTVSKDLKINTEIDQSVFDLTAEFGIKAKYDVEKNQQALDEQKANLTSPGETTGPSKLLWIATLVGMAGLLIFFGWRGKQQV